MTQDEPTIQEQSVEEDDIPVTLEALARLDKGTGLNIIEAGVEILTNLRRASIALTDPEDWLLFRRPDGRVTAYLSDDGCYRIDPIWMIDVLPPGGADRFEFEELKDGDDFAFVVKGNGYCKRTGASAIGVEGVRRSDEDFVREKKGIQKKVEVRKAAFANLHGGIVRKLTGLKNLALTELDSVWTSQGKNKTSANCAQGRGFGTQAERHGDLNKGDYGPTPSCPTCKKQMRLIAGRDGREPFWGCPDYKTCQQKPITAKKVAQAQREPGDDSHSEGPSLGDEKNRLTELLRSKDKIPQSRRTELQSAITKAKKVEDLVDVEAAMQEA